VHFSPSLPRSGDVADPSTLTGIADGADAVVSTIGVTGHGGDPWTVDNAGNVNPSGYSFDLGTYLAMAKRGVGLVISGGRAQNSPIDGADLASLIRDHFQQLTDQEEAREQ